MSNKTPITVTALVKAPADRVWNFWTGAEHIVHWNNASDDWHTPRATVDLKEGGTFTSRMEAKDSSAGFDFKGVFTTVTPRTLLEYSMEDGRQVSVKFENRQGKTLVMETFDPETENTLEMQRQGWQSILDNFKQYAELQARS